MLEARAFEAIARLGHALTRRAPVVLFIDDAQWADAASPMIAYVERPTLKQARSGEGSFIAPSRRHQPPLLNWHIMRWRQDFQAQQAYAHAAQIVQSLADRIEDQKQRTIFLSAPLVKHVLAHIRIL